MRVVANDRLGLSLPTLPGGPWGLRSPEGSLGQLTLPLGVAIDGDRVFVLSEKGDRVYRYDDLRGTLGPLPEIGAEGLGEDASPSAHAEPRRFRGAANIVARDGLLYVADPAAQRVQVFDTTTLALAWIHDGLGHPADLAAGQRGVYVLDSLEGRVYRSQASSDALALVVDAGAMKVEWDRIAVDRSERVYLRRKAGQEPRAADAAPREADRMQADCGQGERDAEPPVLDVFVPCAGMPATEPSEQFVDSAQVRDRFGTAEVHIDGRGDIILPDHLLDPCGLRRRWDAHMSGWAVADRLYVIDSRLRVVRVHLADGRLRHRFGPYDAKGVEAPADTSEGWSPVDLVSIGGCVFILDERHQVVYTHKTGADTLRRSFSAPADHSRVWRRIADDGSGCVLLWDGTGDTVDRLDLQGHVLGQVTERSVRRRFVRDASVQQPAGRQPAYRLTRNGNVPRLPADPPRWPTATFTRNGTWTSRWLDSELHNCQWHVIELRVKALPPGSRIVVRTRTSNEKQSDAEVRATIGPALATLGSWREVPAIAGVPQPDEQEAKPRDVDVLVPSGPGRFIQLQIELTSDGIRTPEVGSLRLRFPRESLLEYLPAIYSKPEDQREFLDRFLAIMQATWTRIEREVDTFYRFLDPDSVPPEGMGFLASWMALRLEGTWTPEQNRRLLQAMPKLRSVWGTADGLRAWLRVYLANLGDVEPDQLDEAGIPGIVESFVERRRLMLNRTDTATLGMAEGLWSPSVARRFQVGVFDREGDVELLSAGDPELDLFARHAHSFRVYVPAALVRTADQEALIRRAIDLQKPAHTTYELVLVEPRFRIGDQSTVGLDTVIGGPLPGPLVCPTVDDPPSRPAYQRLGFDTTLGGGDHERGLA